MKMDDNGSDVGVEQVAKDAMIKVAAVQRLLGAPVLLPLTASTAIVVVLLVLLEGVATNCFLLNATVSHDIDHFIIASAIVIIIVCHHHFLSSSSLSYLFHPFDRSLEIME